MTTPPRALQHRFVAGLGFRTRWTYQASGGRERWLPAGDGRSSCDGGWIVAQQAAALCTGALPRAARARKPSLDEQDVASLLQKWIPNAVLHTSAVSPTSSATEQALIVNAMSARITAGHLVLLRHVIGESSPRWCLASGAEISVSAADGVSALLLLDSALPPVWSCGYNARLEAVADRLVRRTLDGGLAQLRIVSWLAVLPIPAP